MGVGVRFLVVCVCVDGGELCVCERFDGGLFSLRVHLPLSGEINANKGSGEDGRSEKNDKKGLKK